MEERLGNSGREDRVVCVDVVREFQIYDSLPAWLRRLFREANENFQVEPTARLYLRMRRDGLSDQYIRYELTRRISR